MDPQEGKMNKYIAIGILVVVIIITAIYGVFWVSKKVGYEVFYEDLVQQTVKDMVKPEYLNENYKK
jgi:hypothetical protein